MSGEGIIAPELLIDLPAAEAVREVAGGAVGSMPAVQELAFPGPVAAAFFGDDGDVVGIQGPVGSGKTTTAVLSRIRRARMMPRSTIDGVRRYKLGIVRETYRQLWSTTIPSYLEAIPKALGEWSGGRGDPVTHRVRFEDEHGPIEWVAEFLAFGDDPVAAMRGLQFTDMWLNETDTLPVDILMLGIGRIDRWPSREHFRGYPPEWRGYGQIVGDFNAPDQDNWTYRVFHDEAERARMAREIAATQGADAKPIQINFHRQPGARDAGAENLQNLAPNYYARQVASLTLAGKSDLLTRLVDNRVTWLRAGDPVFRREFNPAIHVAAERLQPDESPLLIGLDQGFTPAAVIAQFRAPRHWRVLAELMFPGEHLFARTFGERLADLLDSRFPGRPVGEAWGDIAGEAEGAQAQENATWNRVVGQTVGFQVRPQRLGANRIGPRLEAVRSALDFLSYGQPGLLIDPSCRHLRAGFEARYVWTEEVTPDGNKRKVPNKAMVEANAMDALQYLLLSRSDGAGLPGGFTARASARERDAAGRAGRPGLSTGWNVAEPYAAGGGL